VDAILVGERAQSGTERHSGDEPVAERVSQRTEAFQVGARDAFVRLDFERKDLAVIELDDVPGALRIAPGDDRDEVVMWLDLPRPQEAAGPAAANATLDPAQPQEAACTAGPAAASASSV